jgi:hypothetical protein
MKKIIIFGLCMILLASFISAYTIDNQWKFENTLAPTVGGFTLVSGSLIGFNDTSKQEGLYSIRLNTSDSYIGGVWYYFLSTGETFTWVGWYKSGGSATESIIGLYDGTGSCGGACGFMINKNSGNLKTWLDNSATTTPWMMTANNWYHVIISYDTARTPRLMIFVNGTNVLNNSATWHYTNGSDSLQMGYLNGMGNDASKEGYDNVRLYRDEGITVADALTLYQSEVAPTVTYNVSFINTTPPNMYAGNPNIQNYTINVSCSPAGNISIYWAGSRYKFEANVNFSAFQINETTEGTYPYYGSCMNTNTSIRYFIIDTVAPTISLNANNFFNSINQTTVTNWSIFNLTLNVTFSHNEVPNMTLYAYEFNITHPNGTTMYSEINESLANRSQLNFSK